MRFVCDSCRAQYMISDEKVGPKGVKVRCKKCGYVILVKKADGNGHSSKAPPPPPPSAPMPLSNDPDDALATQVMQNPLGYAPPPPPSISGEHDSTNPGINEEATSQMPAHPGGEGLLGASEDEIGAVFDSVLNSGAHSLPSGKTEDGNGPVDTDHGGRPAMGDEGDDRMSTRVMDAGVVQQMANESAEGASNGEAKNGSNGHSTNGKEIPKTDWFVAIDDKQTGPLTLDRLKEHWERGEIGPDSLCWRAGFSDWIPLSEVEALASELAPRPSKPVIVSSAVVGGSMPMGAVVSVPVESAFSAGGMMKSVRSEVQVSLASAGPEETGSWRPSAASALASLVKDEMEALAKPVSKPPMGEPLGVGENSPGRNGGGLLDLPSPEAAPERTNGKNGHSVPLGSGPGEMTMARGPANPYMQSPGATYSSPAVTQYRPPSNNTTMIAIIALAVVLVVFIGAGTLIFLNNRPTQGVQPTPSQPIAMAPTSPTAPLGTVPPAAPTGTTAAPGNTGQPAAAPNGTVAAPASPNGTAVTPTPAPASGGETHNAGSMRSPGTTHTEHAKSTESRGEPREKQVKAEAPPKEEKEKPEPSTGKPEKKAVEVKGGDDEFSREFGGSPEPKSSGSKKAAKSDDKSSDDSSSTKKTVYIPPAPGSSNSDVKESLGQSDIMEVVKGNISAIQNCVAQQRSKEPGTSGKLVMKWTILTSGKTSKVEVVSDEFKQTYLAGCVTGLIKSWTFPRTKTQGDPVVFPFKF